MGRNSRITVLDSPCRQFPSFLLFMFAFISVLDILCLPASLPLGAAGLHNRLAGLLFLIQRGEKKRRRFIKSVAISDGSTPGYCQIVAFSKAFSKSTISKARLPALQLDAKIIIILVYPTFPKVLFPTLPPTLQKALHSLLSSFILSFSSL